MDSQALVAHLIQNTVILSTAVELGIRWRELAERLGKLSSAQIAAYEAPHRGKSGEVSAVVSSFDFYLFYLGKCVVLRRSPLHDLIGSTDND